MEPFDGQAVNLDEGPGLLQSAWRYKWVVAIAALVGALLGYTWEARQPTMYQGFSQLLLSSGNGDVQLAGPDAQRFLLNQKTKLGSWPVLELAAKEVPGASPALLGQRMTTEIPKDGGDVIIIRVLAPTGEEAARLAKAVGTAYDQFVTQSSQKAARADVKQLSARLESLSIKLSQLNGEIAAAPSDRRSLEATKGAVEAQLDATATLMLQAESRARDGTSFVDQQQDGPVPLRPVQPTPSRGAAGGLLLGLVASAAFVWWLNTKRTAQPAWAAADRAHAAVGGDKGRPAGREPAPREDTVAAGNGYPVRSSGVDDSLNWRLAGQRPGDLNQVEGNGAGLQRQEEATLPATSSSPQGANGSVEASGRDLRALFARVAATLGGEPVDWYLDNLPQHMAEQLTMRVYADMVTLLLDRAEGPFEVAGSIGLTAEEQAVVVDVDNDILRDALREGASVFQGESPIPRTASLPGSRNADSVVVVPLVEGSSWLGMLLVGRRQSANGHRDTTFSDQEIERIILYAMEIAPTLQALLLLGRLQAPLLRWSLDEERAADSS